MAVPPWLGSPNGWFMLLVMLLHCLFPQYFVLIMPSVSIYQNTSGGAVPHIFVILLHHAHSTNMTVCTVSLSEKTINVLCHSPRLMCPQWRGLNQFIQKQGKGGAT